MKITKHGDGFFKGVSAFNTARGLPLVFFGWSLRHVIVKEQLWLSENIPVSATRVKAPPVLRVVRA
jgi:hypothetical protein